MRIEARGVSAGYGRRSVLQGIDLCVSDGELVGLIGPNGAGKSTLLRALSGSLPLERGEVSIDGRSVAVLSARERAKHIAFVPQSEPALFDFTVRDIVLMGRYAHSAGHGESAEDFQEATRAMSDADTLHLAERPITSLSGGEHRRVLLARALAQRAPLMLLDEPTAHLDVTHQVEVLNLLHRLARREGTGVLAALHDLNLAADYCDRLVLLAGGRILAAGKPEDVMDAGVLTRAYGSEMQVIQNPASGRPFLVLRPPNPEGPGLRVHLICGGGTGREFLSALHRRGYQVSAGVLNRLDSDEETASVLAIPAAREAPFSPIGEAARRECEEMILQSDAVVVAPIPVGRGNLTNLELALQALRHGKRVYLTVRDLGERDFTGGVASKLWADLLAEGAHLTEDVAALEAELGGHPLGKQSNE